MSAPKKVQLVTPQGIARFPHLTTPDEFKGKKSYKVNLVFNQCDVADLIARLEGIREEAEAAEREALQKKHADDKAALKKALKALEQAASVDLYEEVLDRETGECTGQVSLKFATNYEWQNKQGETITRKVTFFDASRQKVTPPGVGPGSVLRINFTPTFWFIAGRKGLSLKINAVQIIDLSLGGFENASADELGFEEVEGGFEGSFDSDSSPEDTTDTSGSDDNPDF